MVVGDTRGALPVTARQQRIRHPGPAGPVLPACRHAEYFLLAGMLKKFHYLGKGLALILA